MASKFRVSIALAAVRSGGENDRDDMLKDGSAARLLCGAKPTASSPKNGKLLTEFLPERPPLCSHIITTNPASLRCDVVGTILV